MDAIDEPFAVLRRSAFISRRAFPRVGTRAATHGAGVLIQALGNVGSVVDGELLLP